MNVALNTLGNIRNRVAAVLQMNQRNALGIYLWILKYKNT